jgi:hypothetical protein
MCECERTNEDFKLIRRVWEINTRVEQFLDLEKKNSSALAKTAF